MEEHEEHEDLIQHKRAVLNEHRSVCDFVVLLGCNYVV